jgi:hypothetical protein
VKRLALLAALTAHFCFGQESCPWLNAATASGVLKSAAAVIVRKDRCKFKARSGELEIEVRTMPDADRQFGALKKKCKSDAKPLNAIGNEAFLCARGDHELVIGRVRDQLFTITLVMKGLNTEALSGKGRLVAEQVSGELF